MAERERQAREEKSQTMGEGIYGAGVALEDVFRLLSLAPRERLLSLTFKQGCSQTEELVRAMSLIRLGKGTEALSKLRALGDNRVARCLAETLESHGSSPEAVWTGPGLQLEPGVDSAIELARIFQVLAHEKLCDESQRDRAYQAAVWACSCQTGNGERPKTLERFVEEAREVCASEFRVASKGNISCQDGETLRSAPMRIQGSQGSGPSRTEGASSPPSSLRTLPSSWLSYPSHLEVSMSPTALYDAHNTNWDVQDPISSSSQMSSSKELQERTLTPGGVHSGPEVEVFPGPSPAHAETIERCPLGEKLSTSESLPVAEPGSGPQQHRVSPQLDSAGINSLTGHIKASGSHQIVTPKSDEAETAPDHCRHSERPPKTSEASLSTSASRKSETQEQDLKQEEEEEFYSFVILHSPEDMELASRLQKELESLVVGPGATFTQDFAIPGKHRLSCVDAAINNSAFTILLLSQNFNPRMLEFETNCALMSSLENRHKSNTIIPLFPRENRMTHESIPSSLRMFVPLEEGARGFEKKARKAMAPERIAWQKSVWRQEQRIRAQQEQKQRLQEENERSATLLRGTELLQDHLRLSRMLREQQKMLEHYQSLSNTPAPTPGMPPFPAGLGAYYYSPYVPGPPPVNRPNIHIENASCIMIGNDSQMTVGTGGEKPLGEEVPSGELQE